ncbi:bf6b01cf-b72c-46af-a73e-90c0d60a3fda [Thermothielavioides terrestris]|uniref:Bf6b01cf-b72c-46af-a73e-90c0d60a3fda n=1 Tax=Thermothielavioides terrestris TaxID=2587410 RepID=A0A446BMZ8_9PEZI|nr:bf6b01cf-b72c-46af-a73e-90c0d60a3fda [Thermothielavioides terrestris]
MADDFRRVMSLVPGEALASGWPGGARARLDGNACAVEARKRSSMARAPGSDVTSCLARRRLALGTDGGVVEDVEPSDGND